MLEWITANLATIIISAVIIAIVALIIVRQLRLKKKGVTSCGCGCSTCALSDKCHQTK